MNIKYYLVLLLIFVSSITKSATYYLTTSGSGAAQTASNWNTGGPGGGGTAATNFTTDGDVFIIASGTNGIISGNWNFGKSNGPVSITLTIDGSITINTGYILTLQQKNTGSTLVTVNGGIIFLETNATINQLVGSTAGSGDAADNVIILASGATLKTANSGGIISTTNGSINSSYLTASFNTGANFEFNGASQTMTGLPASVNNLTLSGSGSKTIPSVTINGILSIEGTATITGTSPSYGSSATLQYKGSAVQTAGVELPATFNGSGGIIIDNPSGVILNNNTSINGPLEIKSSAKFNINPTISLSVSGNTSNNGTLKIISDATGTGSFIDNGTLSGTGTYNVENYLANGRWWYLGAPLADATATAFGTLSSTPSSGNRLYYWNETTQGYVNVTNTADAMPALKGYTLKRYDAGAVTLSFSGTLNTGTIGGTSNLTRNNGSGFNLVSNPYPSAIDWGSQSLPTTGLTQTNLEPSVWYRKDGTFATYNWTTGIGQNGGQQYIPAMQGFWVRVDSGYTTGGLELTNSTRVHNPQAFYKTKSEENIFRISLIDGENKDEVVIGFFPDALETYEIYDSEKMFEPENETAQFFSYSSDFKKVAINGQPGLQQEKERIISLGFVAKHSGLYSINVTNLSEFDPTVSIILEDMEQNILQELNEVPSYTFYSDPTSTSNRFKLHFGTDISIISGSINSNPAIYAYDKTIYFDLPESYTVEIYNAMGEHISTYSLNKGLSTIQLNTSGGIYFTHLFSESTFFTEKIFIGK